MRSDVIELMSTTRAQNAAGIWTETTTARRVFCKVTSVSASEFFEAAKIGLRPDYRFTVFAGDYNGETELTYKGTPYAVYRTYCGANDQIELYAETKAGVTNGQG